jgi:hypothetical protein
MSAAFSGDRPHGVPSDAWADWNTFELYFSEDFAQILAYVNGPILRVSFCHILREA